jgi:HD domain
MAGSATLGKCCSIMLATTLIRTGPARAGAFGSRTGVADDPHHSDLPSILSELPLARRAYAFARDAHRQQRRESDAAQFIAHPLEVAALLHNTGHAEQLVAAGILHDTIEDTATTLSDIRAVFGPEIAETVAAMTEDPTIDDFQERKAALRQQIANSNSDATAVYAADKVGKSESSAAARPAARMSLNRTTPLDRRRLTTIWPAWRCSNRSPQSTRSSVSCGSSWR